MDELIHELRSYAHQRLFDGSEKYDQHLLYLADQIEEEMAEKEESLVLMDGSLDAMSNTICELCEVLGVEVKGKNDRQIRAELVEAAKSTIQLPKDADGETIHLGDELEEGKVARIVLTDSDWEPSVYVYKLPNVMHEYFCSDVGHAKPDSWERIIEDARVCLMSDYKTEATPTMRWKSELAELVERCKRLAGEDA